MMELIPYGEDLRGEWDSLVARARNGHFFFMRSYLDYHLDRFSQSSFLFSRAGRMLGLVAGHRDGALWATHRGLTFGGLVLDPRARTEDVREMLNLLHTELQRQGVEKILYRPCPWFHQREPSQEDLYFLFRLGAQLERRVLGTLQRPGQGHWSERRRRGRNRALREGLVCRESHEWERYWQILSVRLGERHDTQPTHTLEEIILLAGRFPEHIRLYAAFEGDEMRAGMVAYQSDPVFHIQYSAADARGLECDAADLLVEWLQQGPAANFSYLSFGNSCEQGGRLLNDGLLAFKEGFGGHGVVYDEYSYVPKEIPSDA